MLDRSLVAAYSLLGASDRHRPCDRHLYRVFLLDRSTANAEAEISRERGGR